MKINEPEFTNLAERVATALKFEQLKEQNPLMDDCAIALECHPTNSEVIAVKHTLRLAERAGYEIHRRS